MKQGNSVYNPGEWSEAVERAESYLRALFGSLGGNEKSLLQDALDMALAEQPGALATHPVTLVMESLFYLLAEEDAAPLAPMTPPMRRVSMLPEPTEFPLHDGVRRLFRTRHLLFAGAR